MAKINDKYTKDYNMREVDLEPFVTDAMMSFFINNNFMRHIPNLQDGLNPVARRIIYGMYRLNLYGKRAPMKSSKVVGEVMATLHPHGDTSIYASIVGMAHEWTTPFKLCEPEGSFGNQYTFASGAADQRYTETKLTEFAYDAYLRDFKLDYTITMDNYDDTIQEPMYLPSRYPMALINGVFGIASGIKVAIPTYNITEVLESTIKVLRDETIDHIYLYPDSPTGCDVIDDGQFKQLSETGEGSFYQQGGVSIDDDKHTINIHTLPYQVKAQSVYNGILDLVESGELQGFVRINMKPELSPYDIGFTGIEVTFKKEIDLFEMRDKILKLPTLTKHQYANFVLIDDLRDARYGIADYMKEWINARREYKQIQFTHKLLESQSNIHRAEVLLRIIDGKNAEEALNTIRTADSREQVIDYLRKKFDVSSLQAKEIASMRLTAFSKESIRKLKQTVKDLKRERKEYRETVTDTKIIDDIIEEELLEGIEKYGRERRSRVVNRKMATSEVTKHRVMVTANGLIKKTNSAVNSIGEIIPGDAPIYLRTVTSDETLMLFDTKGYVYKLPVDEIPASELNSPGVNLSDYVKSTGTIIRVLVEPMEDIEEENIMVTMLTRNGIIKSSDVVEYKSTRKKMVAMKLDKGDEVVDVEYVPYTDIVDIIVYTAKGFAVRYNSTEVRVTGRSSKGVIGISDVSEGDHAIGFTKILSDESDVFVITKKGYLKKFSLKYFRTMRRTSAPLRIITPSKTDELFEVVEHRQQSRLEVYTQEGPHIIDVDEVPVTARMAKGKKTIPVRRGDNIITYRLI